MRRLAPVVLLTAAQIPFMFSSYQPVVVGYTMPQAPPVRPSGLSRGSVAYTRSLTLAQQRNEGNSSYILYNMWPNNRQKSREKSIQNEKREREGKKENKKRNTQAKN